MSLTVRIVWQYILSRVRLWVRPSNFFIREKHPKARGNRVASTCVYLNGQRPALLPAERAVTVGCHRIAIACTTVATAVCVCTRVPDVFALYDKNICPRLIMIMIKKYCPIFRTNQMISPQRVYRLVHVIIVSLCSCWIVDSEQRFLHRCLRTRLCEHGVREAHLLWDSVDTEACFLFYRHRVRGRS